jgi:hypothetical protein
MSATPAPTYKVLVETCTIKEWRNQQTFNVLDSEEKQELRESLCSPDHDSERSTGVAPASEDDLWRDMANALINSRLKNEEDAHLIFSLTNALESAAMWIDSSKDEIWQQSKTTRRWRGYSIETGSNVNHLF